MGQLLTLMQSSSERSKQKDISRTNVYSGRGQQYAYQPSFSSSTPYKNTRNHDDSFTYTTPPNPHRNYSTSSALSLSSQRNPPLLSSRTTSSYPQKPNQTSNHYNSYGNLRNSVRSQHSIPPSTAYQKSVSNYRNSERYGQSYSKFQTNDLQVSRYQGSGPTTRSDISTRNIYGRKITLYHYTTNENASTIRREKLVRSSTTSTPWKYRQHGCGVYFTSLSPFVDPKHLALNNFTNGGTHVTNGLYRKIRAVVEITFYEHEIEKIRAGNRDIYLYRGTINLRNYEGRYQIYKNPNSHF